MTFKLYNFLYNWQITSDNTVPAGFKSNKHCEFEDLILLWPYSYVFLVECTLFDDHGIMAVAEFECENGWYIMFKVGLIIP